jgi:hypothetical protein
MVYLPQKNLPLRKPFLEAGRSVSKRLLLPRHGVSQLIFGGKPSD